MYRPEQLTSHLSLALDNGISKEELGEALTHLAFYASWPSAISASRKLYDLIRQREQETD
jgi:4-carboxymuconolactone decarboxylase